MNSIQLLLAAFLIWSSSPCFSQTQFGSDIDGEAAFNSFGISLNYSADGQVLAIGSPSNNGTGPGSGHVRVYQKSGQAWIRKGSDIDGEAAGDISGQSLALSHDGNTLVIGAPDNDGGAFDAGHVRVYSWAGSTWIQKGGDLDGTTPFERFGYAVDISRDGNTLAVGAYLGDLGGINRGFAKVFNWTGTNWQAKGLPIQGLANGDEFSKSISLSADGNRLVIGAGKNDGNGAFSGHARVFSWNGTAWSQLGQTLNGQGANQRFGAAVSISGEGNTVAIAAPKDSLNFGRGLVRVYSLTNGNWQLKGTVLRGEDLYDGFGTALQLNYNGNRLAVGAPNNRGAGFYAGQARVFDWIGFSWVQITTDIDGEAAWDESGTSVALDSSGSNLAVGAIFNDGNGPNSGHSRSFILNPLLNVGLTELSEQDLKVFPNPFQNFLKVQWSSPKSGDLTLYNLLGQQVYSRQFHAQYLLELDLNLKPGIYFLDISYQTGLRDQIKVLAR